MAEGPNYAGHYRLAVWGCGSGCAMFAAVDLNTGKVITPKGFDFVQVLLFLGEGEQEFLPGAINSNQFLPKAFRYRKDSSLLVLLGEPEPSPEVESKRGVNYFALQNGELRLIHTNRVSENCEDVRP